jgi:serine protease Do
MSSWVIATAVVGAAAMGPYFAPASAQSAALAQDFATPEWAAIEQAVRVAKAGGTHIGVTLRDLDEDDQKGGKVGNGVMIESVETDSPAAKAGIKEGDVIVEFDGERVRSSRQLSRLVQETVPGRAVSIAAMRDGQRVPMTVEPREGSDSVFRYFNLPRVKVAPTPMPAKPFSLFVAPGRLGIGVSELSPQLAEYFGTKDGVLVTSVSDNSLAAKTGVKAGDVITSFDGAAVNDTEDLRRRSNGLDTGAEFTIGIVRDKKTMTLKGKLESPRRVTGRTIL